LAGCDFAFRTADQDPSWSDVRSVWTAADDIELFESSRNFDRRPGASAGR
jgi:hypothetical protein